ncbi:MAG TPA: glycosyltransferase family 4 protein [Chitinophagaceae bacterium]|nr:glycosyltransferase family 4 protein [Chitinophagaceae bacterium]
MRIAFISYEFPPDTGVGGIGTYTFHIAHLFGNNGVDVEVICASNHRSGIEQSGAITVVRVQVSNANAFYRAVPHVVAERNFFKPFDLLEVPEYGGGGGHLKKFLNIPLIVKLHTPAFLVKELNDFYYNRTPLRRLAKLFKKQYCKEADAEYQALQQADFILSPSRSLKKIIEARWKPSKEIKVAPYPFQANEALLQIPLQTTEKIVLYTGRMETRKGVYNLAKAIPLIVAAEPDAHFIFVGSDDKGPLRERSMKKRLLQQAGQYASHVTFVNRVPLEEIPLYMRRAAVCVYPSLWENFPNVCLEAMAAGRAVVGSNEGGMADMLQGVPGAQLVNPQAPADIAAAIIYLLQHPTERQETARQAREKIKQYYNGALLQELIALYQSFVTEKTALY